MPQNQSYSVILFRLTGETEQRATMTVTAKSKKAAADIALGRAEDDDTKVEWSPRLPQDVTPGETVTVESVNGEPIETSQPGDLPPGQSRQEPAGHDTKDVADSKLDQSRSTPTSERAPEKSAPLAQPGTVGGKAQVPDLEGPGTFGTRVDGATGAHVNVSQDQLDAERDGHMEREEPRPPRAKSDPALASAPGCGGVKAALNNPIPRPGEGGRVLDVNNDLPPEAENAEDDNAEKVSAADVQKQQKDGMPPVD